jgi:hypothetical protein
MNAVVNAGHDDIRCGGVDYQQNTERSAHIPEKSILHAGFAPP